MTEMSVLRKLGFVFIVAAAGCVGEWRPTTASLSATGVTPTALTVDSSTVVEFKNGDARDHQIRSDDCTELSTPVLAPGQRYDARLGRGPKSCHFDDVLVPN